ncbi:acyl-CoA synthetase FdrA [Candidatus Denitrolinea symbiosum]|jgi:succinyl-CoA synthetase alpha subunit|nr:acyl-CoA synthetase FdrA [Candidatus Denitrolinea symbiosum]GER80654.1 acyl-CoA synthetase FdrA [Candidatus Denitrolinea symbiosum]
MLRTIIKKNSYQDSINLMLLTNEINTIEGVIQCSIMMGTDANKDIFKSTNLLTEEAKTASPTDMVMVMETNNDDVVDHVLKRVDQFLSDLSVKKQQSGVVEANTLDEALEIMPDANLALFSIPGEYAADVMEQALERNLNIFSFTDNVSVEDEVRLKKLAHEKGLVMMGPDCGTGILSGIPLAFTNVVKNGNIGIVGASGTGIQEVSSLIDRLGSGVTHAIGTGGRDLSDAVQAITVKDSLIALENYAPADVIVLISKPPAKSVRDEIVNLLHNLSKPVVAIFLGENPTQHENNVYLAHTLEEAARIAVDLANGNSVKKNYLQPLDNQVTNTLPQDLTVKGLYSGGTLGGEAAMLISQALDLGEIIHKEGYLLNERGYQVIDYGDDMYTQGHPHPMIDPATRIDAIKKYGADPKTGIILLDVALGYGSHPDMAGVLAPVIRETLENARKAGRQLYVVATVCGTRQDPQNYDQSAATLKAAGALVEDSNAKAVRLALQLKGVTYTEVDKQVVGRDFQKVALPQPSSPLMTLLTAKPRVINIGLESFNESIRKFGGKSVQYSWRPIAGGNKKLIRILNRISKLESVAAANQQVIERMRDSQPFLVDVVPAKSVIEALNRKVLLHAGPPIQYSEMTGPMQGSCVGAALFEGWAKDEAEARRMLEAGEVEFMPCHHVNAVGPMGGITSGNMAVLVVENKADGTVAYCTMNEGIGKVLRFGAFSEEVVNRLHWMADVLGPTIAKAVKSTPDGINLNVVISKAITMGDEFHQRNIAGTLVLLKELVPLIDALEMDRKDKQDVLRFLANTDQFFLNVMMAVGKAIVDYARKIQEGTVVTTMTRNGKDFGIRIAGMGDDWFTAPVNTPHGLYFTGYTEEDANPDIGDSAITETVGVGAMVTVAAPAVTRFVGSGGGYDDALRVSNEMNSICLSNNPNWSIPNWNFKGACLGIDAVKVVATGITPLINTGIAHKKAGVGQVGAGTATAPLACFEKAILAYAKKLGIDAE